MRPLRSKRSGGRPVRGMTGCPLLVDLASLCSPHGNHHDPRACAVLRVLSPQPALPLSGRELCGDVRLHCSSRTSRCFGVDAVTGSKSQPNRTSAQVRSGPLRKCRNGFDLKWKFGRRWPARCGRTALVAVGLVRPYSRDLSTSTSQPGEDGSKPCSTSQRTARRLRSDHHAWITSRSTWMP